MEPWLISTPLFYCFLKILSALPVFTRSQNVTNKTAYSIGLVVREMILFCFHPAKFGLGFVFV